MHIGRRAFVLAIAGILTVAVGVTGSQAGDGPTIGTFSWMLEPFTHVVTFTVAQEGATYVLSGSVSDGGTALHPAYGTASQNSAGGIDMAFTTVYPGGVAVHTKAVLSLVTLSGTWTNNFAQEGMLIIQ